MRPLHLTVVTAVSTAVLLATTSVLAVTPKVNLGTLKPQEAWKVGTVENNGEQYCAMVGSYSKNVVVAFARNPEGLGSLALDFGDALFTPGSSYDVSLTAPGQGPRTFSARASAPRSIVVQIGQDASFYDALAKNGTLGIDMPAAALRVDLAKFSTSHNDLVECAGTLAPSATQSLPEVREAKTNVDRELEELSRAKTQLADASTKADSLQKDMAKKTSSFDEIEAQLEAEARAEAKRSRETIASIEAKQTEVRSKLEDKGVQGPLDLAVLEPAAGAAVPALPQPSTEPKTGGRKLLAAIGSREPVDVPFSTGSSSRDIEARQLGLADANRAAVETQQALELKNEIASLEAQKNAEAQEKMAAFDNRQEELKKETKVLSEKRDNTLAKLSAAARSEEESRGLRANVVAQQAKIAAVSEVKQAETAALTKTLASTQADYETRIAALEAERQSLRDQVQSISAENARLKQSGQGTAAASAEDRLEIARLKKQLLDMETQRQGELARASAAQRELDDARQQLAVLRQGGQAEQARLAALTQQLETERKQLETARAGAASAATAGVETARQDLAKKESELAQRQSDLDKQAEVLAEESQRLNREKQDIARVAAEKVEAPIQLTANSAEGDKRLSPGQTLLTSSQRLVDAERAELNDLRGRIKSLEQDLAKARDEASVAAMTVAAAPKPVVIQEASPAEKAELARLKDENSSLRQRLAGFLSGSNKDKETVAVSAVPLAVAADEQKPVVLSEQKPVEKVATPVAPVVASVPAAPVEVTKEIKASEPVIETPIAAAPQPEMPKAAAAKPVKGSPAMAALGLTADELNATEPAAGTSTRAALPTPVLKDNSPGNDKRMPAVPAAAVVAEEVKAPVVATKETTEKTVSADEDGLKMIETKTTETVVTADAPVVADVPAVTEAELEIARLAPITAPVPRTVNKQEQAQDKGVFGIFGRAMGYGAAKDRATQQAAAPQPAAMAAVQPSAPARPAVIRVTHPQPSPQVAAAPTGNNGISGADANRAEAFLDNIMAFHRPDGAAPAPSVMAEKTAPAANTLNQIETAAGGAMAAPVSAAPSAAVTPAVPAAALSRPAYLEKSAPAVMPVAGRVLPLQELLREAGVGSVQVSAGAGQGVHQWTTGNVNGLYERQNATGSFGGQVEDYLARYRADCPGKLDVRMGDVQKTANGKAQLAELNCSMAGNTYATTVAFLEAKGGFHAVLHAGQVADAQQVRGIGSEVVRVMKTAEDIRVMTAAAQPTARVVPVAMTAPVTPAAVAPAVVPVERPRFRIEIEAPAAAPQDVYDLPTTIVE